MNDKNIKSKLTTFSLVLCFILSLSTVFAACNEIFVSTDKETYYIGDAITVSGTCQPDVEQDVAIQVNDPLKNVVFIAQPTTDNEGRFSVNFVLGLDLPLGTYTVYVSNGVTNITEFMFLASTTTTPLTTTITTGGGGGGGRRVTTTTTTTTITISEEGVTTMPSEEPTVETTIPSPIETTTTPQPMGITGAFLQAMSSLGYWWIMAIIIIILAIAALIMEKKYRKIRGSNPGNEPSIEEDNLNENNFSNE